jgi:Transglycosylase-like domain
VVSSTAVLERMLAPPPPPPPVATTASQVSQTGEPTQSVASAPTSSTAGASGAPACASESGTNYSTGPANTNPASGATGRYQILPSTAGDYGWSLSTPAGQDACAQTIYQHQGAGAWVGCGG